mgnify:CR=1 FL=1
MRKRCLLSLLTLFCVLTGWAQVPGTEKGFTRVGAATITEGMNVAFQTISSTNPYNWFNGEGAAGSFSSKSIFVVEATGNTAEESGQPLYRLRQKNAEADVAYLQAPSTAATNITMGPVETAVEVEFRPYSEQPSSDGAEFADQMDNELTTRVTAIVNGTVTRLNCNANYPPGMQGYPNTQPVRWATGMASWSFWNIYQVPEDLTFATINYNVKFFDGTTNNNLADNDALVDLIPEAAAEGVVTVEASIGDSIVFPTFANNELRRALAADGTTEFSDTTYFFLTEEMLTNNVLTLNLEYSSYPRITFHCTQDVSMFTDVTDQYPFSEGGVEQDVTSRVAPGDSILPPALSHFTALTKLDEIATESKTINVSYRPWRMLYYDCVYTAPDGSENYLVSSAEMYIDVDSILTAPDQGDLYEFDAEATAAYEMNDFPVPAKITPDNLYDGFYYTFCYTMKSPLKTSEVTTDGKFPEDATWYIMRMRGNKVLTSKVNDAGRLLMSASAEVADSALWCFSQNADGTYNIYNKGREGEVLTDFGGAEPQFTTATGSEIGFELISVTTGYGFRVQGTDNVWNDHGGNGTLAYYTAAATYTDPGSTITFEEYKASNYTFLDGRAVMNAVNCINGYTEDQVAEISEMVESGETDYEADVTELVADLLDTPADELIQHDPTSGYAIISAAPAYIQRENVKYALYAQGDTLLAWKEFNPWDRSFYFELRDRREDKSVGSEVADSISYALYHIASQKYVDAADWAYAQPLKLNAEYNDTTMHFHLDPAVAVYNNEGSLTRAAVPAGFYIDRWWYSGNKYGAGEVLCTMSMHAGSINNATEGSIVSYNTRGTGYSTVFRFWDGGPIETVGIGSVTNDENVNGAKNDVIYDLSGRRVQKAVKGIYIQNGKKVYVK